MSTSNDRCHTSLEVNKNNVTTAFDWLIQRITRTVLTRLALEIWYEIASLLGVMYFLQFLLLLFLLIVLKVVDELLIRFRKSNEEFSQSVASTYTHPVDIVDGASLSTSPGPSGRHSAQSESDDTRLSYFEVAPTHI